ARTVERIVQAGIPVMGHIGLTPQSVQRFGGFRVQGRSFEQALQLVYDAEALEAAGAFAIVLELVPAELAQLITERLHIPTIGIGAGTGCDGQVQVFHDILGLFDDFVPRHTKRYTEIGESIQATIAQYAGEVKEVQFPADANSFTMKAETLEHVREKLAQEEGRHASGE
ncbi:MAG: 3-methyl-2-oxobutanoate hydroxymethyltransferase, partial [Aggregatilineales bacterium]